MPITPKQLEKRKKYLGGSDMPAIMGLDPWRGPKDVYIEKTSSMRDQGKPTVPQEMGNLFEGPLLDWASKTLGPLRRNQFRVVHGTPLGVNLDAQVIQSKEPVEAKTNSIAVPVYLAKNEDWGEDGSDNVPERVIIQCQTQMMATNEKRCHVPTVIGGRGLVMFCVPASERIMQAIAETSRHFWTTYVVPRIPPPGKAPAWETIRRVIRDEGKEMQFDIDQSIMVMRWRRLADAQGKIKKMVDAAKCDMVLEMDDASVGHLPDGSTVRITQSHVPAHSRDDSNRTRVNYKKGE